MRMTKFLLSLSVVALFFGSPLVLAQEEEAVEKPLAGWDNGFYLNSKDGDFKMKVGGRLQFKNEIQKISGLQKKVVSGRATTADTFSDSFSVRRARIQTSGTIYEKLDWTTVLNVATARTGNPNTLWFVDFTYNFAPYFRVGGGMVQMPMDRIGEDSSKWYLSVEPPLTATQSDGVKDLTIARDAFGLPYDLGLRIDGDIGSRFTYAVAAVNGSGFQNFNANNELSYSGRVQVNILDAAPFKQTDYEWSEKPKLSVGAGTGFEDQDAADENVATITRRWSWSSSGDLAFRWRGFSLNSEVYHRVVKLNASSVEDTNGNRKLRDVGYYANAGYFVIPHKLELMATAAQIFREGPDNNANEFGGGLNWYIHKGDVKIQLDYTNVLDYDDVVGLNNATYHRIRTMFSLFL